MTALFRHILLTVFVMMLLTVLKAQGPHPGFRQYTVEDGLPSSDVYQVKQDSKGYIWFATGNGVSRFDGYRFENFSLEDGLPDNTLFEIFEDRWGRIWFLSLSCQLSYYYNGKIYAYPHNGLLRKTFRNFIKSSFFVNDTGSVFLGLAQMGIFEITPRGRIVTHSSRPEFGGGLDVIEPEPSRFVFYGNLNTITEYTARFNTRLFKGTVPLMPLSGKSSVLVFRLIPLHDSCMAFSYAHWLYVINKNGEIVWKEELAKRIHWISEDRDGDLWVGTYLNGVFRYPKRNFHNKLHYLAEHSVTGVLQDREGGFWFTTEGRHVFYASSKKVLTLDIEAGLPDERINCLATDGESLFAGSRKGWVYEISEDMHVQSIRVPVGAQEIDDIISIYYDVDTKELIISTRGKMSLLKSKRLMDVGDRFNTFNRITKDSRGRYWGGVSFGLYLYSDATRNRSLSYIGRVNGMLPTGDRNEIWLGSISGLWKLDTRTYQTTYWGDRHPLLKTRILDLAYIGDSTLVMASKGAGILLYHEGRVWQIDTRRGLCDNSVNEIFVEGNTIWGATAKGLNRITFDPAHPFSYRVERYTTTDGLASNEIKDVVCVKDRVWVATQKGLSFFDAREKKERGGELPTYVNRVWINGRAMVPKESYRLDYDQNTIRIDFTGLGYRDAGKLSYRYRMLGLDSNWTYTENRETQFTTLPGGQYRLEVSTRNGDGSWSRETASVNFLIVTPFWERWWFRVTAILLSGTFIAWVVRYRLRFVQREKERGNELNRNLLSLKLKALRAQMNPHFTFNVMNSIQHFILNKEEESAHRYLSKFSRLIRLILNNSETDTVSLGEERKALELYLELESMRFDHKFEYEIHIDPSVDTEQTRVPSMLIQPYVENAILHGLLPLEKGGRIDIRITKEDRFLKCVIEDNGIGRAAAENKKDKQYRSFGTSITKERLSAINELHGSLMSERIIDLCDNAGHPAGTRIEIYIPLINADENESDSY